MPYQINGEHYLTATEAAKFLQCSPTTFVKHQKQFHLQAITRPGLGQRKLFRQADLEPILQYRPIEKK